MAEIPPQIKASIDKVLEMINDKNFPQLALSSLPTFGKNVPSNKWSLLNRMIMMAFKTSDARGIRQWRAVGRKVKKGSKAFYILAPITFKTNKWYLQDKDGIVKDYGYGKKPEAGEGETITEREVSIVKGFRGVPVFRKEDTYGKKLPEGQEPKLPKFKYLEVAKELGVKVKAESFHEAGYGSFNQINKEIKVGSPAESVFYHELAHAVDHKIMVEKTGKGLKGGQHVDQEVVAELCAVVLAYANGKKLDEVKVGKNYILSYARNASVDPMKYVVQLMSRCEDVLAFITKDRKAMKEADPSGATEAASKKKAKVPKLKPEKSGKKYAKRVRELEAEGMTTSDAQAVADAQDSKKRSFKSVMTKAIKTLDYRDVKMRPISKSSKVVSYYVSSKDGKTDYGKVTIEHHDKIVRVSLSSFVEGHRFRKSSFPLDYPNNKSEDKEFAREINNAISSLLDNTQADTTQEDVKQ